MKRKRNPRKSINLQDKTLRADYKTHKVLRIKEEVELFKLNLVSKTVIIRQLKQLKKIE